MKTSRSPVQGDDREAVAPSERNGHDQPIRDRDREVVTLSPGVPGRSGSWRRRSKWSELAHAGPGVVGLLQPHGFEGLASAQVGPNPDSLPACEGPDERDGLIDLYAAPTPPRAKAVRDYYDAASIGNFAELELDVLKCLVPSPPGLLDAPRSARDAPIAPEARVVLPHNVPGVRRMYGLPIASPVRLPDPAHQVHVFLRHRPASIPLTLFAQSRRGVTVIAKELLRD